METVAVTMHLRGPGLGGPRLAGVRLWTRSRLRRLSPLGVEDCHGLVARLGLPFVATWKWMQRCPGPIRWVGFLNLSFTFSEAVCVEFERDYTMFPWNHDARCVLPSASAPDHPPTAV